MRIEARIQYWKEGVLTFDPEKVLERLKKFFPRIIIDPKDYSLDELEKFIEHANKNIEEPMRTEMIESMRGKNRTNGPSFRFRIPLENEIEIIGAAVRYHVEFNLAQRIDPMTEKNIIDFLTSLKYGQIVSNEQTDLFCVPSESANSEWFLKDA